MSEYLYVQDTMDLLPLAYYDNNKLCQMAQKLRELGHIEQANETQRILEQLKRVRNQVEALDQRLAKISNHWRNVEKSGKILYSI